MKKMLPAFIMGLISVVLLTSCRSADNIDNEGIAPNVWSQPSSWFNGSLSIDASKTDVFYLVSTDVVSAFDQSEGEVLCSQLTDEDKSAMDEELEWIRDSLFLADFNFISPYYHQYTFDAIIKHADKIDSVSTEVGKEAYSAFDYYMKNLNQGRPFILAGFSQGGDMAIHILRQMTPEQYQHMVAAYVIGFKVTASDTLNYATIRPAKGETDTGVVISYNSVLNVNGIWDFVARDAAACINPVNWKVDATPADFTYEGRRHTVSIDWQHNVLVVDTDPEPYNKWMNENPPYSNSGISIDCLHHWELLFFSQQIHDNAVKRNFHQTSKL